MAADNMADLRNSSLTSSRLVIKELEAINSTNIWKGGAGSDSASSGAAYYEATVRVATNGVCRLGWSKCLPERNIPLGYDYNSIGFGSTARKSHDGTFKDYGVPFKDGDVIGCYINFIRGVASFSTNGISHGTAFIRDGVDIHPLSNLFETALYPAFCLKEASVTLNFGPFEDIEERTAIFETAAPLVQGGALSSLTAPHNEIPNLITSNWIDSELVDCGTSLVITNLQATNSSITMMKGTGSQSVSSGTAYYEAKVNILAEYGECLLGWSTNAMGSIIGLSYCSMGFCSSGRISHDHHRKEYAEAQSNGDIIGCYIDLSSGIASFSTNGISHGTAFTRIDLGRSSRLFETALYPAFCLKEASVTLNFGPFDDLEERTAIFNTPTPLTQTAVPWIDLKDHKGNTLLHEAAFRNKWMAVSELIERGASVEVTNDHERTPLHTAVLHGCYEVALLLVDAGSNIFADDIKSTTPLEYLFYQVSEPEVCSPEGGRDFLEKFITRSRFTRSTFWFLYFCKLQSQSFKRHYLGTRAIEDIDDESHKKVPYIFQGRESDIARLSVSPAPAPAAAGIPPPPTEQEQAALSQLQSCEMIFTQENLIREILSFL